MNVWIVVPNHNGQRWLPPLIDSIEAQTRQADGLVVVDDSSTDGSLHILRDRGVKVVRSIGFRGFAPTVNLGIAAARQAGADAVALVNTDIVLAPDWLECATGALAADDRLGSVATKLVRLDNPGVIDDAGNILRRDGVCEQRGRGHGDGERFSDARPIWGPCAGAALYRLEALSDVGVFDPEYGMYLEDVDLALRLRLGGWECRYVPAVARHAGGGTGADARFWVARNTLLLVARWFPLRWLPMVAYRQMSWLYSAARTGTLRSHLRGLAAGLRELPTVLKRRRSEGAIKYREIAAAVPARQWRGAAAGGHPEASE